MPAPNRDLRGEVWWADFGNARGSAPAHQRPAIVVSADRFNKSALRTVTVVQTTTNVRLARYPGNVLMPAGLAGLREDSVAVVTQMATLDKMDLEFFMGRLPEQWIALVDAGLRTGLDLAER